MKPTGGWKEQNEVHYQYIVTGEVHWQSVEVMVIQESHGMRYKTYKLNGDKGTLEEAYEAIIGDRRRRKRDRRP